MRSCLSLVLTATVVWLSQGSMAFAVPPTPSFAANYQNVWTQDFTTLSALSVSAHGPCGPGGTTWMAHKPRGGDWFIFQDPIGPFNPFGLGNGSLTIRVQKNGAANNGFNGYTGGLLASVDDQGRGFAQKFGYFEVSMQLPGGPNTWPAFWLLSLNHVSNGPANVAEIDIMEGTGNGDNGPGNVPPGNPNYVIMNWHRYSTSGQIAADGMGFDASKPPYSTGLATGFHTYGVDVEPSGLSWYFDRQLVWTTPIYPEATEPLFVLLNLALGSGNYNNANGTGYDWNLTPNPSDLKVQYVAVWASPNSPNYVPPSVPSAPTGLSASGADARVTLSWNASSSATSYSVYRATSPGGQGATALATLSGTSYTDNAVSNGTTYYYRVSAANGFGSSALSSEANATPNASGGMSGVLYEDSFSRSGDLVGSQPNVNTNSRTWSTTTGTGQYVANGSAASVTSGAFSYNTAYLPVNGSSGVVVDGTASFTLSARVTPGSQGVAGISLHTLLQPNSYYNMYSNSVASLAVGGSLFATFSYGDESPQYDYSLGFGPPAVLTLSYDAAAARLTYVVGSKTVRTQNGVNAAQIASLRAIALGNHGYGSGSAAPSPLYDDFKLVVGASTGGGSAPATPTGLSASAGNAQVGLSWAGSSGATSYVIHRATSAGGQGSTPLATVTSTSYSDTAVSNGTRYYYRVAASNAAGSSALSNEANALPSAGTPPPAPTSLAATAGNAQVALSWGASTGATSYAIYRATSSGGQGSTPLATVTSTSYSDTAVSNGTRYYYRVAASNAAGSSALSNEANAQPMSSGGAAGTVYLDNFARSGELVGSTPNVTTNARTWTSTSGSGQFVIDGSAARVTSASYPWNTAFLPVNGSSGVTLDGSTSFTLSALVAPGSQGVAGLSLHTALSAGSYQNMYSDSLAMLAVGPSLATFTYASENPSYDFSVAFGASVTVALSYNAGAGTLTYSVGSKIVRTQAGVTPALVSSLRAVALGNHGYGGGAAAPAPSYDDFKLVIGP